MASQEKEAHPSAAQFIMHDFYVDDGLTSVESAQQAKDLIQGAREICEKGGLRLLKFVSNDCQVLESVPKSEGAVDAILNRIVHINHPVFQFWSSWIFVLCLAVFRSCRYGLLVT